LYTEEDWSDTDHQRIHSFYMLSKTLAERAAWHFHQSLPESERFEMVTILPGFIVGRPLHCHDGFTSAQILQKIFTGEFPVLRIVFPVVRVDDVALAHLKAIIVKEAANQRFSLIAETKWIRDLCQGMADEFNHQGYNV